MTYRNTNEEQYVAPNKQMLLKKKKKKPLPKLIIWDIYSVRDKKKSTELLTIYSKLTNLAVNRQEAIEDLKLFCWSHLNDSSWMQKLYHGENMNSRDHFGHLSPPV